MMGVMDMIAQMLSAARIEESIANITEDTAQLRPWCECSAFLVTLEDGRSVRFSIRTRPESGPVDLIDFIGIPADADELIVVYLNCHQTRVDEVPPRFIPASQWQAVRHLYWAGQHPYETINPVALPEKPERQGDVLSAGGTRGESDSEPLFSIITIVFNGASLIEQTIQSVIHNKDDDVEYVVIDGGSSDGSLEIVNSYGEFIDYWISEPDTGIYDALNKGIGHCRGRYIGAIHATDFYAPDAITRLREAINHASDQGFFFGGLMYVDNKNMWVRGKPIRNGREVSLFGYINHPTCFIHRDLYAEHGRYNDRYRMAGDYELAIRYWDRGVRFQYVDAVISYFRLGGVSSSLFRNQWERHRARMENHENVLVSLAILVMVIVNYCLRAPARWLRR